MLSGGIVTILILTKSVALPTNISRLGLDASVYGIFTSAVTFVTASLIAPDKKAEKIQTSDKQRENVA